METQSKPLIACPACASRLIHPRTFEPLDDGRVVVERRCPECEHADRVACSVPAAEALIRREARIRTEIARTVLDLELEGILAESGPATQPTT